jgi:hypothetical protein
MTALFGATRDIFPIEHFACWRSSEGNTYLKTANRTAALYNALDGGLVPRGGSRRPSRSGGVLGKTEHIQVLLQYSSQVEGLQYSQGQVILIDDDMENVQTARNAGFWAFHCPSGFSSSWYQHQLQLAELLRLDCS